jgi:hypothetical protein
MTRFARSLLVTLVLSGCATLAAAQPEGMPPVPKPGPEHDILKADVGVWDAVVEMFMAPGQPPTVSKGVETNTLLGGMWLVNEFTSEMMGMPFQGHGISGYDPVKKKYVGVWVDTISTSIARVESQYDAATKTMTGVMEATDMTGTTSSMKETVVHRDPNTRVFTMFSPGPDGKDAVMMRITYTRRK